MEQKLKTLKEISLDGHVTLNHDLRKEAIKWYHRSDGNKHKFIMEFFNITDKEIEEGKNKNESYNKER